MKAAVCALLCLSACLVCGQQGGQLGPTMPSYAYGPGITRAIVASPTSFTIQSVLQGTTTNKTVGGMFFRAEMRGPNGLNKVKPAITDNGDGTYTVLYTVPYLVTDMDGTFQLTVTGLNDYNVQSPITGSPFPVLVSLPSVLPVDGRYCSVMPQPSVVTAGDVNYFTIFTKDSSNAVAISAYENFQASITDGVARVTYKMEDQYQGEFYVTTGPTKLLSVSVGGTELPGSPFTITVNAGEVAPEHCYAAGVGVTSGREGEFVTFTVTETDQWDNPRVLSTGAATTCTAKFQGAASGTNIVLAKHSNGVWGGSYTMPSAGMHYLDVEVNGQAIAGSPFAVSSTVPLHATSTKTSSEEHTTGAFFGALITAAGLALFWLVRRQQKKAATEDTHNGDANALRDTRDLEGYDSAEDEQEDNKTAAY